MTDSRLSLLNLHMSVCLVGEVPFLAQAYSLIQFRPFFHGSHMEQEYIYSLRQQVAAPAYFGRV